MLPCPQAPQAQAQDHGSNSDRAVYVDGPAHHMGSRPGQHSMGHLQTLSHDAAGNTSPPTGGPTEHGTATSRDTRRRRA